MGAYHNLLNDDHTYIGPENGIDQKFKTEASPHNLKKSAKNKCRA